mmetsp:Transcript_38821/g.96816  ORF Transcript_38821/g.96816 Transcript_38821/m.96816 type:complete len:141 (-) Transcript_38821:147-569(-)
MLLSHTYGFRPSTPACRVALNRVAEHNAHCTSSTRHDTYLGRADAAKEKHDGAWLDQRRAAAPCRGSGPTCMSASTVGTRHGCRVDPAPSVAASCRWLLSLARHAASVLLPDCSIVRFASESAIVRNGVSDRAEAAKGKS